MKSLCGPDPAWGRYSVRINCITAVFISKFLLDCTTIPKLMEAIIEIWYHDGEIVEKCKRLVKSMPNRVNDLLNARAGHIKY